VKINTRKVVDTWNFMKKTWKKYGKYRENSFEKVV